LQRSGIGTAEHAVVESRGASTVDRSS
jgi:hypothetical protein